MNKALVIVPIAAVVAGIAFYVLAPLFTDSVVDEPLPEDVVVLPTRDAAPDVPDMQDTLTAPAGTDEMPKAAEDTPEAVSGAGMAGMMPEDEAELLTYSGTFVGLGDGVHETEGDAYVLPLADGSNILRFENCHANNGPDLYVYLSTDRDASEFVSLGRLKANIGDQNYEIPDGTDLSKYDHALVWCKPFGVLFGGAELSPQQ